MVVEDAERKGANVVNGRVACPLLILHHDESTSCSDRNSEYYLGGCNVFPIHPSQIVNYPSCTYEFEKIG
jgi:hypothetical protein